MTGLLREEEQPQPESHQAHHEPTLRQEPAPRTAEPPRAPEAPRPVAQQRLAIDAGRAPLPRSDEDALDIPAFLRRQANWAGSFHRCHRPHAPPRPVEIFMCSAARSAWAAFFYGAVATGMPAAFQIDPSSPFPVMISSD